MMKTIKYLSMAALAMVGAIVTGCANEDDSSNPQQPANQKNVITLSATVGFNEGAEARATTRALTAEGVKTFAAGETMALVYQNTNGETVKAVSAALPEGDYGSTATFTFELTDPDKTVDITYIYPAAMANDDGTVNYDALATQDGTLSTLSSSLDLATYTHAWDGTSLPTGTLANQLAILSMTLKDNNNSNDITSSITGLTLSDGTYNYAVTRSATAGPIYVAIHPTYNASIKVTATSATNDYSKSLTAKTYAASNGYNVSWRMTPFITNTSDGNVTVEKDGNGDFNLAYGATYSVSGVGTGDILGITSTLNIADGSVIDGTVSLTGDEYYVNLLGEATISGYLVSDASSGHVCHISGSGTLTVEGDLQAIVHLAVGATLRVKGTIWHLAMVKNAAGTADVTPTTDGDYKVYVTPALSTMRLSVPLSVPGLMVQYVGYKFNTQDSGTELSWNNNVEYNGVTATFTNIAVPSGASSFDLYINGSCVLTGIAVAEEVSIAYNDHWYVTN